MGKNVIILLYLPSYVQQQQQLDPMQANMGPGGQGMPPPNQGQPPMNNQVSSQVNNVHARTKIFHHFFLYRTQCEICYILI